MDVTILNSPPNASLVKVNAVQNNVIVSFGYLGPLAKTLVAGENVTLDQGDTTITINAPTQPIDRLVKTTNYILQLSDAYKMIDMNVATDNSITVPPNSSVAFELGTSILISQYGAGTTEILEGSGVVIRSESSYKKIFARYCGAVLIKIGTDEWYLQGALKA